jgi:hypothetical protein
MVTVTVAGFVLRHHTRNGMNDIDVGGYVTPLCEAVMRL